MYFSLNLIFVLKTFLFQAISIFLMALIVHMQRGGESTQMYNPFFETNLRGKL